MMSRLLAVSAILAVAAGNVICQNSGTKVGSSCVCTRGYFGPDCTYSSPCNKHGQLLAGECDCSDGYTGTNCTVPVCNGKGTMLNNRCDCEDGWEGANCQNRLCNDHGHLTDGKCTCDSHWSGEDCQTQMCNGHGIFNPIVLSDGSSVCVCEPEWTGAQCETVNLCSGHGRSSCFDVGKKHKVVPKNCTCVCEKGFTGKYCDIVEGPALVNTDHVDAFCCVPHASKGCHSRTITQCVCDVDESCCTGKWDRSCVGIVADKCGECPKGF